MNTRHRKALESAIARAETHMNDRRHELAMTELETAHVLGQARIGSHLYVHWLMLRAEIGRGSASAALGQAVRLLFGVLGHALGRLPRGNTGGSNVSMFEPMPIDPALAALMRGDD